MVRVLPCDMRKKATVRPTTAVRCSIAFILVILKIAVNLKDSKRVSSLLQLVKAEMKLANRCQKKTDERKFLARRKWPMIKEKGW